ncbi:hypothetical protein [Bradyrhizobium cosmicum]|uniref:Uncharacterized protein n=1 Tax=Bradyrhizobium cosmicum TaxID=1404864 RepID=A0AAI8QE95_9BRAD|nr:hypothetical protein [Bradyrhizobium cosmicum]BAL78488.1 hypothetical protein S23_52940 [Bradyrhizobium cosmicum]
MAEKFDPAPADKHADPARKDRRVDKADDALEKGLKDSFPASDPPSSTQPGKTPSDGRN